MIQIQFGVRIPLRDGVHLKATLYLPLGELQPLPAIVTLTPYIGQTYHDFASSFAADGYAFLTVDVRGRGDSAGEFWPFRNESSDGFDVVEWLCGQSYCNGRVAMWGGSYAGYAQWVTAKEFPPHLVTIVPVASPYLGVDFPMCRNIPTTYMIRWLTVVAGRASQDKIFSDQGFWSSTFRRWHESGLSFRELDTFCGKPSAIFQEWLAHPRRDSYWDAHNPTADQYARLDLPILTITGIYDGDQLGALAHYRQHLQHAPEKVRRQHYLIIGPWDHAGTRTPRTEFAGLKLGSDSLVDLQTLHSEWYAWTMRGGQKPEFLKKNVAFYVTGAERWCYADTLEEVTAATKTFYLRSTGAASQLFRSGLLTEQPAEGPPDTVTYDPRTMQRAQLDTERSTALCLRPTFLTDDLTDQRALHILEGQQLVYHNDPFERDTEISGFFQFRVWISINCPDTDFSVNVYEVDGAGASLLLTTDYMRARYRESFYEERLVRTAEPLCYEFTRFTFTARRVPRGGRLRLTLGPIHSIFNQRNHNTGNDVADERLDSAQPVTIRVFHDVDHPSALYVPLGHEVP